VLAQVRIGEAAVSVSSRLPARLLQLRAALRKARLGEAQKDEAEDRPRVLARLEAGVGAELVGGDP